MLGCLLARLLACSVVCLLSCLLARLLARLLDFLRSVGHIKPNAAHCFCAVAFQGGVAASAFLHRRFCFGVSPPACLHRAFLHQLSAASRCCSIVFYSGSPAERQLFRWKCLSMDCICSDARKSFGLSAPIAYATYVYPPDEAVAWPETQVFGVGYGCYLAGDGVRGNHRARMRKLIIWL